VLVVIIPVFSLSLAAFLFTCFHCFLLLSPAAFLAAPWRADCYAKASGRGRDRTSLPVMAAAHAIVLWTYVCVCDFLCVWVSVWVGIGVLVSG